MPRKYRGKKYRAASKLQALFRGRRARKKTTAAKLKTLAKKVNKDIEHRWSQGNFSFQIPASGGDVIDLGTESIATTPTLPNGTDNRLGKRITLKRLFLKGQLLVADSRNFIRILLVRATSLQQIIIASDVLEPDPISGNPSLYSPYRKESKIKFKVLYDKFYKTQTQAAGAVYPAVVNCDLSFTWKSGMSLTYNLDTVQPPIYGDIKLIVISDSTAVSHPSFRGYKRLSWIA